MDNNNSPELQQEQLPPQHTKIPMRTSDFIFAVAAAVLFYLLVSRSLLFAAEGTISFIAYLLLYALAASYVLFSSERRDFRGLIYIALGVVFLLPQLFSLNIVINMLSTAVSYFVGAYGLFVLGCRRSESHIGDGALRDGLSASFAKPFGNFTKFFRAICFPFTKTKKSVMYSLAFSLR